MEMPPKIANERLKKRYREWLQGAKGYSEATIVAAERELSRWEEFTDFDDLGDFTIKRVNAFKKWLEDPGAKIRPLSLNSRYHCLHQLRQFFLWLEMQSGYKSKVSAEAISYLSLDRKSVQTLTSPGPKRFPGLDYVKALAKAVEVRTEIDQRDRALIAFLLLSGMRDKAVTSLPLGCLDPVKMEVQQYPSKGVDTKFGKSFATTLLQFDATLVEYVLGWVTYLQAVKLFSSADPLFPRCKVVQAEGGLTFESREVEPVFWRGTGSIRLILKERAERAGLEYFHPHSFRHAHVHLALKYCHTAEQIRAVSQNLGHENIGTTLTTYGKLDQYRVGEVISGLDLGGVKENDLDPEAQAALQVLLSKIKRNA